MEKIYKFSTSTKVIALMISIILVFGSIDIGRSFGVVFGLILLICAIWVLLMAFKYKIIITEEYICIDIGRLGKRFKRNWDEISRIYIVALSFKSDFVVRTTDESSLRFSDLMKNYSDLLTEIVKRSPNAEVDESVRDFLYKQEYKKKHS